VAEFLDRQVAHGCSSTRVRCAGLTFPLALLLTQRGLVVHGAGFEMLAQAALT
jgi:hypothetical protein